MITACHGSRGAPGCVAQERPDYWCSCHGRHRKLVSLLYRHESVVDTGRKLGQTRFGVYMVDIRLPGTNVKRYLMIVAWNCSLLTTGVLKIVGRCWMCYWKSWGAIGKEQSKV